MQKLFKSGILLTLFVLLNCAGMGRMHIRSIQDDPARYSNQEVVVKGKVVQVFALPFIDQGVCKIDDGTGEIWVKPRGRVPAKGENLRLRGTVKVGLTLANKNFGLIVIENKEEAD